MWNHFSTFRVASCSLREMFSPEVRKTNFRCWNGTENFPAEMCLGMLRKSIFRIRKSKGESFTPEVAQHYQPLRVQPLRQNQANTLTYSSKAQRLFRGAY